MCTKEQFSMNCKNKYVLNQNFNLLLYYKVDVIICVLFVIPVFRDVINIPFLRHFVKGHCSLKLCHNMSIENSRVKVRVHYI